jgi:Zn-finger nucleic acid-binding protein
MAKKPAKKPAAKGPAKKPAAKGPAKKPAPKAKPAAKAKPKAAAKAKPRAAAKAKPADDGAQEALATARADAQRLDAELEVARAETTRLAAALEEVERERDAARSATEELERRLAAPPPVDPARAELQAARVELQAVEAELAALRPRLEAAEAHGTRLEEAHGARLEEAQAAVARLEVELTSVTAERDGLRAGHAELDELRATGSRAAADLAAATRRADEHEEERRRLQTELDTARAELGSYKLRCPKCGKSFVEEQYEGITIDRCTGCDGIYFDAGEVDQLLANVNEKMAAAGATPEGQQQASGWFRNLFKKKVKIVPSDGGGDVPPA